jgi:hypothetical protein
MLLICKKLLTLNLGGQKELLLRGDGDLEEAILKVARAPPPGVLMLLPILFAAEMMPLCIMLKVLLLDAS